MILKTGLIRRRRKRIERKRVAIIGGGSWPTALAKLFLNHVDSLTWYIRNPEDVEYFKKHGCNPKYLSSMQLPVHKVIFTSDIKEAIANNDVLLFGIPSAFLHQSLNDLHPDDFKDKFIISAIKGIIPENLMVITDYFNQIFDISYNNMAIISGPCHAEEIASERLSYLTVASKKRSKAESLSQLLVCDYIHTIISRDIIGIEYAAILKNIIAIGSGICHSIGYGDNFQAVLVSNAIREMKRFIDEVDAEKRTVDSSAYLGDLLVTAYSQYSRNRTFGTMIGKGYSVKSASLELNMIAEGYYASKCIHEINLKEKVKLPIIETVYQILYENKPAAIAIKELTVQLH